MFSPAGLEEANHSEFCRSKEMNSDHSHVSLEEDLKPQMRSQPGRQLVCSLVRPWAKGPAVPALLTHRNCELMNGYNFKPLNL